MANTSIYQEIAARTNGDVYIGVVGPVRTGKSSFIKKFMECLVLPNIEDKFLRERTNDELPQSGSGKTITTSEPKFIPEDAVSISLDGGVNLSVRLIDCVGFMVDGAAGQFENGRERYVTTPWFDEDIAISRAAEEGTRKVINDHSTIGLVVTTDGTICDLPREAYIEAEERTINELKAINKPFAIMINSADPKGERATALCEQLSEKYGVNCRTVNCLEMDGEEIESILYSVLGEFPLMAIGIYLPQWVEALDDNKGLKADIIEALRGEAANTKRLKDISTLAEKLLEHESISDASSSIMTGNGTASLVLDMPKSLYYSTISEQAGLEIKNDRDLIRLLLELKSMQDRCRRISEALDEAEETGYGIVAPDLDELELEEPEIVKQNGKYGIKLRARAPSMHIIKTVIETEVSPAIGGESASEEILGFLLQGYEGDMSRLWESNIFGRSMNEIANDSLVSKIEAFPAETQGKLQETLQRIINEGSGGLICIIL